MMLEIGKKQDHAAGGLYAAYAGYIKKATGMRPVVADLLIKKDVIRRADGRLTLYRKMLEKAGGK